VQPCAPPISVCRSTPFPRGSRRALLGTLPRASHDRQTLVARRGRAASPTAPSPPRDRARALATPHPYLYLFQCVRDRTWTAARPAVSCIFLSFFPCQSEKHWTALHSHENSRVSH